MLRSGLFVAQEMVRDNRLEEDMPTELPELIGIDIGRAAGRLRAPHPAVGGRETYPVPEGWPLR